MRPQGRGWDMVMIINWAHLARFLLRSSGAIWAAAWPHLHIIWTVPGLSSARVITSTLATPGLPGSPPHEENLGPGASLTVAMCFPLSCRQKRGVAWIATVLISSAAQGKASMQGLRCLQRKSESCFVWSETPDTDTRALMKPLWGALKVNLVAAQRTETLPRRPSRQETLRWRQRSKPRKLFHAALVIRSRVLKFNLKHVWRCGWVAQRYLGNPAAARLWVQFQRERLCLSHLLVGHFWHSARNVHIRLPEDSLLRFHECVCFSWLSAPAYLPWSWWASLERRAALWKVNAWESSKRRLWARMCLCLRRWALKRKTKAKHNHCSKGSKATELQKLQQFPGLRVNIPCDSKNRPALRSSQVAPPDSRALLRVIKYCKNLALTKAFICFIRTTSCFS